jgi:tRNA-dihydrouridine synthase 3
LTGEEIFRGRMVMAPMSRGTDLPFRVLATECGAEVCLGEMAYAHRLARRARAEMPLARRHPAEKILGIQLAGKDPAFMAEAARVAEDSGADFVDVNLGCPIDEVTRRGFGASLLKRTGRVRAVVEAMKEAVSVPVTVKMRLGWSSEKPTFLKVARAAQEGGVDAVILHPRSRAQRYRRPADWERVRELVEALDVPVIGNGDIMDHREARRRMEETGCAGVMVGRWALAKPWLFREFAEGREFEHDPEQRLAVVSRYVELCREYFGDDEKGRGRIRRFLTFHQDFFRRYRRGAAADAVNSDDPRNWGEPPADDLERWLCRGDAPAVAALCDWLVDGIRRDPPPEDDSTGRRAVKTPALG